MPDSEIHYKLLVFAYLHYYLKRLLYNLVLHEVRVLFKTEFNIKSFAFHF